MDTGTIRGTITDPTGRPVTDAQVINNETASDGAYLVTPLHPGTYSVTVSMTGFDKETKTGITLDFLQNAVVACVVTQRAVAANS